MGKGTKIMAVANRNGLPVSVCAESATPHEATLATHTLLQMDAHMGTGKMKKNGSSAQPSDSTMRFGRY